MKPEHKEKKDTEARGSLAARHADIGEKTGQNRASDKEATPGGAHCKLTCQACPLRQLAPRFDAPDGKLLEIIETLKVRGAVVLGGLKTAANAAAFVTGKLGLSLTLQPQGTWFTDVKVTEEMADRSDSLSGQPIPPHNDGSSLVRVPDVAGLFCLVQSANPEPTLIVDFMKFAREKCTESERHWMMCFEHVWSHTFDKGVASPVIAPIITVVGGKPVVRFSTNLLLTGESSPKVGAKPKNGFRPQPEALEICRKLISYAAMPCNVVRAIPQAGDLVLLSNGAFVHLRGEIKEQSKRHFSRFWAVALQ